MIPATTSVSTDALSSKLDEDTIYFFCDASKNVILQFFSQTGEDSLWSPPPSLCSRSQSHAFSRKPAARNRDEINKVIVSFS